MRGVSDWPGVTVENVWEGAGIHITFLDCIITLCDPNDMVNTPFSCKPQLSIAGLFSCCHRFKHTGHSFSFQASPYKYISPPPPDGFFVLHIRQHLVVHLRFSILTSSHSFAFRA